MSERNPFDPGGDGDLSHLGAAGVSGGASSQGKGSSPAASSSGGSGGRTQGRGYSAVAVTRRRETKPIKVHQQKFGQGSSPAASSSGGSGGRTQDRGYSARYEKKRNETDRSHQQKLGQDLRRKIEE